MKIGITCYPTYGGSGVVATELGKALAARGHQIHFISYALPSRLDHFSQGLFFHEVAVNTYPLFEYPPYSLALTSKMVDVVAHEQLDLLHVHYAIPHASSAVLARQILLEQGIYTPVVTTLHGTDITIVGQDPSYAPVVTYSINQSDGVTAVSDYLRNETFKHFGIRQEIEVIPNFVDTERFKRQNRNYFRQTISPNDEKVLVHVSNFRGVKRVADVVHVLARLRSDHIPVKLLMVGDGPERVPAEHLARELGVEQHVFFLGKQEPVEEILSVADLFIMPSTSETFGLAALEAMSCGVPVISTNIGGLPELNVEGETGYLCNAGDIAAFSDRAAMLLTDESLHAQFSAAARERATQFDVDQIVPLYEAFYEQVRAQAVGHAASWGVSDAT